MSSYALAFSAPSYDGKSCQDWMSEAHDLILNYQPENLPYIEEVLQEVAKESSFKAGAYSSHLARAYLSSQQLDTTAALTVLRILGEHEPSHRGDTGFWLETVCQAHSPLPDSHKIRQVAREIADKL